MNNRLLVINLLWFCLFLLLFLCHISNPPLWYSVTGITETIAQLASGWVTDRNLFHKYHFHKAYLILCGLVNLLSPLATSYILLMVYAVFFAIFCGGYMALLLPVLVRLILIWRKKRAGLFINCFAIDMNWTVLISQGELHLSWQLKENKKW